MNDTSMQPSNLTIEFIEFEMLTFRATVFKTVFKLLGSLNRNDTELPVSIRNLTYKGSVPHLISIIGIDGRYMLTSTLSSVIFTLGEIVEVISRLLVD